MFSTIDAVPECVPALYEALRTKDLRLLLRSLDPAFVLSASAGMPLGVGGVHEGAGAAVGEVWGVVHAAYDIAPVPASVYVTATGTVVVHGWYEGTIRRTGEATHAEFVHLLEVEDDRLVSLRQITDTASWGTP
ncbi:MAG TPA: nuclear transport factor 2 family protein [Acidimicrobiales bacterium]|nr:nuclear transport factor 2 family protein [Acidimicrobiales bacterium]